MSTHLFSAGMTGRTLKGYNWRVYAEGTQPDSDAPQLYVEFSRGGRAHLPFPIDARGQVPENEESYYPEYGALDHPQERVVPIHSGRGALGLILLNALSGFFGRKAT